MTSNPSVATCTTTVGGSFDHAYVIPATIGETASRRKRNTILRTISVITSGIVIATPFIVHRFSLDVRGAMSAVRDGFEKPFGLR